MGVRRGRVGVRERQGGSEVRSEGEGEMGWD